MHVSAEFPLCHLYNFSRAFRIGYSVLCWLVLPKVVHVSEKTKSKVSMICHTARPTLDAEMDQMRTFAHKILALLLKQLFKDFQNWVLSTLLVCVAKRYAYLKNAQKSALFVLEGVGEK